MFGHHNSLRRDETDVGEGSNALLGRSEALALFFRLQSRGYFPCMVEEDHGKYRVFVGSGRQ